ncbi:ATP-binding cassette domain-containing protein [Arthrobacter sp. M4]|uniref:ATP-binding cassette domain-containing protein n=1 Tax=Arthrobacter sp. M4 TaxID=218160 RepID=UPI001CDCB50A|nr:ATP-binding cassette domain-containing protein [Arthrobacter sp. M4]MCA4132540.1 ATP-binding cassette domain-containing protein [Arthrobacter sp. M4]
MTIDNFTDTTGAAVPLLEVKDAVMRFGAVTALNGVNLTLNRGEILALLGDNGAGKSTMIKCISGVQQLSEGQIYLEGQPVSPRTPKEARELGIETVYQDLALFDNMSAAQNFFAGRELTTPKWMGSAGFVRRKAMVKESAKVLERLQVGVHDPNGPVGLMSGGQRQAVAVARAEAWAKRIVILDEPTAALGVRESRNVLELVKRLPQKGISVILISHNMEEVMALADRAIVFRQGRLVGEAIPTPENHEKIVSMIVGADTLKTWS